MKKNRAFFLFILFTLCAILLFSGFKKKSNQELTEIKTTLELNVFIKDWMLCGPFPNQLAEGVTEYLHDKTTLGYSIDYLKPAGGEGNVIPKLGQSVTSTNGNQNVWEKYKSKEDHINLSDVYEDNQRVVAYAAVTIISNNNQEVVLSLGSNDGIKAWVNGEFVWDNAIARSAESDEDWVKVKLKKGDNRILLKVVQGIGAWGFYARFLSIQEKREELLKKEQIVKVEKNIEKDLVNINMGRTSRYLIMEDTPEYIAELYNIDGVLQASEQSRLGDKLTFALNKLAPGLYRIKCSTFLPTGNYQADDVVFFYGKSNLKIKVYDKKNDGEPVLVEMLNSQFETIPNAISIDSHNLYSIVRPDISPFYLRILTKSSSLGYRWLLADNNGKGYKIPLNGILNIDLAHDALNSMKSKLRKLISIPDIEESWMAKNMKHRLQNDSMNSETPEEIYHRADELSTLKNTIMSDNSMTIWSAPGIEKIAQDEPAPKVRSKSVNISLARNEYEAFQLAIKPNEDMENISIDFTPFKNDNNVLLDQKNISVSTVDYVNIESVTDYYGSIGLWPDPISPITKAFTLQEGKNLPLWISIFAPKNQASGIYKGEIKISAKGMTTKIIPLQIKIHNFTLPDETAIQTAFGVNVNKEYHGALSPSELSEVHDLYMQFCAEHRISPYSPQAGNEIDISFPDGSLEPIIDYSKFDKAMHRYLDEFKFTSFRMDGLPKELAGYKLFSPEYNNLFIKTYSQIQEHLREKGWLEKAYWYWVDEPPLGKYEYVKNGMELLKKACPDIRRLLTFNHDKAPLPYFYNTVDLWVPQMDKLNEELTHERQKMDEKIWWYVCTGPKAPYPNNFIDHPAINHRIRSWMVDKYNLDGSLYWSVTYWIQNPWEQAMAINSSGAPWGNGDGRLFYPPRRTKPDEPIIAPPITTIRFENLRDGIEDIEYLKLLRKISNSGDLKAQQALAAAQNYLVQSTTSYEQNPAALYILRLYIAEIIESHEEVSND